MGKANLSVSKYLENHNISYSIIDDYFLENKFTNNDIIIKSASIKDDDLIIRKAKIAKAVIVTDIGFYALIFNNDYLIGITGTFGKTTTAMYLYYLLQQEKVKDVYLVGNIGRPIFDYVSDYPKIFIIELSSFQLEFADELKLDIMIYLNFYSHHLEHHKSFLDYLDAKLSPLKKMECYQKVIFNYKWKSYFNIKHKAKFITDYFTYANGFKFLNYTQHEIDNLHLAYIAASQVLKIENCFFDSLKYFKKPSYRMERKKTGNFSYINDSKATSLYALRETINTFNKEKIILIAGGVYNKNEEKINIDFQNIRKCYFYGENRFYLKNLFKEISDVIIKVTLEEIVKELVITEELIIFSPGAKSYDQFPNFEERGKAFDCLMNEIFCLQ